jgi:hypothetical protein
MQHQATLTTVPHPGARLLMLMLLPAFFGLLQRARTLASGSRFSSRSGP